MHDIYTILSLIAALAVSVIYLLYCIKKREHISSAYVLLTAVIVFSVIYISFFKDLSGDAADQADANDKILLYLKDEGSEFYEARKYMIQTHLIERGITDEAVLTAMGTVKRQLFVDIRYTDIAYNDHPLPIGEGQTISQPYIVALMTQAIGVRPGDRVLEIGTGSGYQAAVLSETGQGSAYSRAHPGTGGKREKNTESAWH